MPARRLKDFLEENDVPYVTIQHSLAYTASDIAAMTHIKGRYLAKTVMVMVDGRMAMAVLPSSFHVDLDQLRESIDARSVELADEDDFKNRFPGCEVGAMPPFGNLYGMDVYVDNELAKDEEIAFNAGSHTELLRLSFEAYAELVRPRLMDFRTLSQAA